MQERDAVAEAGAEAGDRLRREADLRHEHDRAPALGERPLDGREVDLGLARAGDAVQEQAPGSVLLSVEGGRDPGHGGLLVGVELRAARRRR